MDALATIEQNETVPLDWDAGIVDVKVGVVVGIEKDETHHIISGHEGTIAILEDGIGMRLGGCGQAGHRSDDIAGVYVAVIVEKVRSWKEIVDGARVHGTASSSGGHGPNLAYEGWSKGDLASGLASMMMRLSLLGLGVDQDLVHRRVDVNFGYVDGRRHLGGKESQQQDEMDG